MPINPALHSQFANTIGAWTIGSTASTGLLGITTLQSWIYFTRFPKDPLVLKFIVALIWSLEASRTSICVYGGYYHSIQHWGDVSALHSVNWSLLAMVLLTAPIELLAHLFFAHQVRCITTGKYRFLFHFIVFVSIIDFGFGIASYITAVQDGTLRGIINGLPSRIANGALVSAIVVDWTITICLVSFLRKNQSVSMRGLMQTLMIYAINFGLLISLTDIVVLILTNVKWSTPNLYQVSLFEVIGNLYAITVLASLNSRTLVAEHLYHSSNLHSTSINAVSTQIHGFHHPHFSTTSEGDYHVSTVGATQSIQITTGLGGTRGSGGEGYRSMDSMGKNMV